MIQKHVINSMNLPRFAPSEYSRLMRLLIADDHDLVRDTLAEFMRQDGVRDVVTASDLLSALEIVTDSLDFDLILLDYNMPGMNGLLGLERMKAAAGNVPVAILSGTASPSVAEEAIAAGAAGFIPKTLPSRSIISAANMMAAGEVFVPFNFMNQKPEGAVAKLSERERSVLRGICEGKSNKEIARDLKLQEVTIKLHVKTLSRKLEARNRTHAAMIAKSNNFV